MTAQNLTVEQRMKTTSLLLAAWAAFTSAQAQTVPADRAARTWAATCAACHASQARAPSDIPPIAGRDADSLYRTLLEFKNGQRPTATVMHQHAKGYSDEELRRIALALASTANPR